MTITEAMRAAGEEYDEECQRMQDDPAFAALAGECIGAEYDEIDRELAVYVGYILQAFGWKPGAVVPQEIYQLARMCVRMGMRTQRKLDRPDEKTSLFWRSDRRAV